MAARLIQARELNRLDAPTAAERLGVKYSTYKNYENGDRGFTRHATRFAQAFKVDLIWLMTRLGSPRPKGKVHPVVTLFEGIPPERQHIAIEVLSSLQQQSPKTGG